MRYYFRNCVLAGWRGTQAPPKDRPLTPKEYIEGVGIPAIIKELGHYSRNLSANYELTLLSVRNCDPTMRDNRILFLIAEELELSISDISFNNTKRAFVMKAETFLECVGASEEDLGHLLNRTEKTKNSSLEVEE